MTIWVLDSNILVSGLLFPYPMIKQIVHYASRMEYIAFSDATFEELETVFKREKFDKYTPLSERRKMLRKLEEESQFFYPADITPTCSDPDDDKFLALASACNAEYLITGDRALLSLAKFRETEIIKPVALHEKLALGERY